MRKAEVEIGAHYRVQVSGQIVRVRILRSLYSGGWEAVSLKTGRTIHIRTAQRLRPDVPAVVAARLPIDVFSVEGSAFDSPSGLVERGSVPDCIFDLNQ